MEFLDNLNGAEITFLVIQGILINGVTILLFEKFSRAHPDKHMDLGFLSLFSIIPFLTLAILIFMGIAIPILSPYIWLIEKIDDSSFFEKIQEKWNLIWKKNKNNKRGA